jgi:hypothetical protein
MDIEMKDSAAECAKEARRQVALLAPGKVRDALLEKAKQYEAEVSKPTQGSGGPSPPASSRSEELC